MAANFPVAAHFGGPCDPAGNGGVGVITQPFMKHLRFACRLGIRLAVCCSIAGGVEKVVGYCEWRKGRGEVMPLPLPLEALGAFVLIVVLCFLVLEPLGAPGREDRKGARNASPIPLLALVFALGSPFVSRPRYLDFLDGFASRAKDQLRVAEAKAWAAGVFANTKAPPDGLPGLRLESKDVPAVFEPLFGKWPRFAVVSFSDVGTPVAVNVFAGGPWAKWGVVIFNTNAMPANDNFAYRPCAEGVFAFHSQH